MPYRWSEPGTEAGVRLELWPHRSMPPAGFAAFIGLTFLLLLVPLFPLIGTPVLWGLLPFLMGALALLWIALRRNYADASLTEELTVTQDHVRLVRHEPRRPEREWEANPHWVRVTLHRSGGPVPNYLTLAGGGREVEIGAFLSEEERVALERELRSALRGVRPPHR